ncbi:EspA/EspE family type VII secretion system effector [Mycobacterium sp. SM1]|uniref:EspA/EspE family type VII secretion system effector n=1 Tax=Mycobacterium sp. SM1 TaxID=2816243 RepID=UPI001F443789|nr:EspA/EspE family type VII secretion system effector [Mycobacterium sp. SM1]
MSFFHVMDVAEWAKEVWEDAEAALGGDPWGDLGLATDAFEGLRLFGVLGEAAEAAETPIIDAGLFAIETMTELCGSGEPDTGEKFGDGQARFNSVGEVLGSAFPDDSWEGTGSQAYVAQNTRQQDRARTMADADVSVKQILSCEAGQVRETRETLEHEAILLRAFIPPAVAALAIPVFGEEISLGIQIGAVAGILPVCEAQMLQMSADANNNAQQLQQAIGLYREVASTAHPTGTPFAAAAPNGPAKSAPSPSESPQPPGPAPTVPAAGGAPAPAAAGAQAPAGPAGPAPGALGGGAPLGGGGSPGGGSPGGSQFSAPGASMPPGEPAPAPLGGPGGGSPLGASPGGGSGGSTGAGPLGSGLGGLSGLLGQAGQLASQIPAAQGAQPQAQPGAPGLGPSPATLAKDVKQKDVTAMSDEDDHEQKGDNKDAADNGAAGGAGATPGAGHSQRPPVGSAADSTPGQESEAATARPVERTAPQEPGNPPATAPENT